MGCCRLEAVSRDGSMRVPISALSWPTHGVTTRLTHWYQQTCYTLRCGSLHGAGQGWQALSHKGLPHPVTLTGQPMLSQMCIGHGLQ